jgi:hypothetical protein
MIPNKDEIVPVSAPVIGRTADYLRTHVPPEPEWLVPGVLAKGQTTELNGREKIGKGWFEAYLIGAMERGTPTLFGPSEHVPARTLIYTEEPEHSLREKLEAFDVKDALIVYHWELGMKRWTETIDWLVQAAIDGSYQMLFVDNISAATGTVDENGVELARHVEPLRRKAMEFKLAVLIDRHQRKSGGDVRDRSRGGTALAGAVDQIIAMEKAPGNERKLESWGRLWKMDWTKTVELTEDHSDYVDNGTGDFRERVLTERAEWTVREFAAAITSSEETARIYLEGSALVALRKQKRGNAHVYDVIKPPELS